MSWRALRPILLPILRSLVGETAALFLDPCCRVLFWQRRAIVRRLKGKRSRFASWRYRRLLAQCAALHDEQCTAAEAADRIVVRLIEAGDDILAGLIGSDLHRLREVADLLGPESRAALGLPPNH